MPALGVLLRDEINRLARKQLRQHLAPLRNSATQQRSAIVALNHRVSALEDRISRLERAAQRAAAATDESKAGRKVRFAAKGLRTLRARSGLSAGDFGRLVGVSGQSIYNWEREVSIPKPAQVHALAAIRGFGKRALHARLSDLAGPAGGA